METWHIVLIATAVAIVVYMLYRHFRKRPSSVVVPSATEANVTAAPLPRAPGVASNTGQLPNNIPPPPPPGSTAPFRPYTPSSTLQHIPIVGGRVASVNKTVSTAPMVGAMRVNSAVTSSLEHIPVAGKVLAAPTKVIGKVGGAVTSALSSIF
jgi:hypothetical protein